MTTRKAPGEPARTREARRQENRERHWRAREGISSSPGAWDGPKAMRDAHAAIAESLGIDVEAELAAIPDPVDRARRHAELAAALDMHLTIALTHGTSLDALEQRRGAARLVGELALRRLAIAGLRPAEAVEHDLSDRMAGFLSRFFGRPEPDPAPLALEPRDPDEPGPPPS